MRLQISSGLEFTERMAGFVALAKGMDYEQAADAGEAAGSEFSFTLTVGVENIDAFVKDAEHTGTIIGTVHCPAISPEPLDVVSGRFNLMRPDASRVETRRFDYVMEMHARDGEVYDFNGYKVVRGDEHGMDLWKDTTTLFVDITRRGPGGDAGAGSTAGASPGAGTDSEVVRGILRIKPTDFARQMTTMHATGGGDIADKVQAVARFGMLFASTLFDVYGGILAPARPF